MPSRGLRIGKACKSLKLTNRSIEYVSWTVGYPDRGALRRLFNDATGSAPTHYRRCFDVGHKT